MKTAAACFECMAEWGLIWKVVRTIEAHLEGRENN